MLTLLKAKYKTILLIVIFLLVCFVYLNRELIKNIKFLSSSNVNTAETKGDVRELQNDFTIPTFENYRIDEKFSGKSANLDLNSHPNARDYQTRISDAYKKGPNFAGHYTIALWGCGTSCQVFAISDNQTGKVYFPDTGSQLGIDYKLDSNLIIINPKHDPNDKMYKTEYYQWVNNVLIPINTQ